MAVCGAVADWNNSQRGSGGDRTTFPHNSRTISRRTIIRMKTRRSGKSLPSAILVWLRGWICRVLHRADQILDRSHSVGGDLGLSYPLVYTRFMATSSQRGLTA